MELLAERLRTVIWLYDIIGLSHKEIAAVLGIRTGNVRARLHRARKKLRALLTHHCVFERDERNVLVCEPKPRAAGEPIAIPETAGNPADLTCGSMTERKTLLPVG
jgi:hypothetical protein